jgi:predicted transcriptional regulator
LRKHRDIQHLQLAKESGYCRQYILKVRRGDCDPSRSCIAAITEACRRLTGEPVRAIDLFELDPDSRYEPVHPPGSRRRSS